MKKIVAVLAPFVLLILLSGISAVQAEDMPEVVNVGNKICPVSGDKINGDVKATYEYEGKVYNFCCPMCIEEFKKDPQKYIKKVDEELRVESEENTEEEEAGMEMMHEGHQH